MSLTGPNCLTVNRVPECRRADEPVCDRGRAQLPSRKPRVLSDAAFCACIGGSDIGVAKVDTMSQAPLAARYRIRGIPALLLMRRGVELGRLVGAASAQKLVTWIDSTLQRAAAGVGS